MLLMSSSVTEDRSFDGFTISVQPIHSREDQLLWGDYEKVKEFLSCPWNQIHKFEDLHTERKEMFHHLDCHLNETVFIKCDNSSCCLAWQLQVLKSFLANFNVKMFAPTLGSYKDGHCESSLQSCNHQEHAHGDSEQPTT